MRTSPVSVAAGLLVVYAADLGAYAVLNTWWGAEIGGWGRFAMPLVGFAVARGVWRRRRWAWWFGTLGGGWFGLIGVLALVGAPSSGIFAARPYPAADYAFLVVSVAAQLGAAALLVLPRSRAELPPSSS
jgi:hypothetical protein